MNSPMLVVTAVFAAFQVGAPAFTENETDQWLEQRFTRTHRRGNYTTDPDQLKRFQPSGVCLNAYQLLDVAVVHNHALYWSSEDNPDDSKDMLASVVVFRNNKRVFAARGYKFRGFQLDQLNQLIQFDLWTGTMGHNQIRHFTLDFSGKALKVAEERRSTKDG